MNSLRAVIAAWLNASLTSRDCVGLNRSGKGWIVKHFHASSTCPTDWVPCYRNINMHVHMYHTSIYISIRTYARTRTHSHASISYSVAKEIAFSAVCGKSSYPERTRYRSLAAVNHRSRERTRYRSLAAVNHRSREQSKTGKPKYTHHKLNLGQYNEVLRHEY